MASERLDANKRQRELRSIFISRFVVLSPPGISRKIADVEIAAHQAAEEMAATLAGNVRRYARERKARERSGKNGN